LGEQPNPPAPFPAREGGAESPPRVGEGLGERLEVESAMPVRNIVVGQKVDQVKLQRAKELRRQMTREERILWQQLRTNRLQGFHFRRQQVIAGFIADFYCHAAGLVVEMDGGIHQQQAEYDVERDRVLSALGLRILRIRNIDILENLAGVLERIAAACRAAT